MYICISYQLWYGVRDLENHQWYDLKVEMIIFSMALWTPNYRILRQSYSICPLSLLLIHGWMDGWMEKVDIEE